MKRSNLILLGVLGAIFLYFTVLQFSTHNYVRKGVIEEAGVVISKIRSLPSFRSIDVRDNIRVYFKQDSLTQVTIKAPENFTPYIKTKVDQGSLLIEKTKSINTDDTIKVFISSHYLDSVKVHSAASFKTIGVITGKELVLEFRGESTGDLEITYDLVQCKKSSDATITLKGNSKKINFLN